MPLVEHVLVYGDQQRDYPLPLITVDVEEAKKSGIDGLPIEDEVALRQHPELAERIRQGLLAEAAAAGLLTQIGSLAYSVTKNAAVALAEWIAITYGDRGIGVAVRCPQAGESNIRANSPTADLLAADQGFGAAGVDGVMSAEDLAGVVVEGLADGRFHILPHPEVAEYVRRKGDDVDRWLSGMRRFQQRLYPEGPTPADWLTG